MSKTVLVEKKLSDVQQEAWAVSKDMRKLYQEFSSGSIKREDADTQANIAGKNLKALSLVIADQMRQDDQLHVISRTKALEEK